MADPGQGGGAESAAIGSVFGRVGAGGRQPDQPPESIAAAPASSAPRSAVDTAETPPAAPLPHTPPSERIQSIDVLRGFDMFWISGGDHFFHVLARATGWASAIFLSNELEHSKWIGFTFYDLIQPLFLFIAGMTLPLAIGRRLERGQSRAAIIQRLLGRTALLVVLGHLVKNGALSLDFAHLRYTSVLGRIGVSSMAAALIIMYMKPRAWIVWIVGILAGYWALLTFVAAPGQPVPNIAQGANIVDYLDQHIMPGRLISGNHDANGWSSLPPVVATVLLGALAGLWLRTSRSARDKCLGLAGAGMALVSLGWLWHFQMPIIKHIWTSSFVLFTAGWSCLLAALFYGVVDGLRWRRWGFPLLLIGMNPLLIYFLVNTGLVDFTFIGKFFFGFTYAHASQPMRAVGDAVAAIAIELGLLYALYRRKIFWRV